MIFRNDVCLNMFFNHFISNPPPISCSFFSFLFLYFPTNICKGQFLLRTKYIHKRSSNKLLKKKKKWAVGEGDFVLEQWSSQNIWAISQLSAVQHVEEILWAGLHFGPWARPCNPSGHLFFKSTRPFLFKCFVFCGKLVGLSFSLKTGTAQNGKSNNNNSSSSANNDQNNLGRVCYHRKICV